MLMSSESLKTLELGIKDAVIRKLVHDRVGIRLPFQLAAVVAFLFIGSGTFARAGVIYLNYTNFETRLSELSASAGITAFSAGEVTTIKSGIKSALETSYTGFTGLSFTETDPGGTRAELNFGLTASPGGLGAADHIDFLNRAIGDVARVFTANFDFIVDEFSGSTNRGTQLSQLTAALAGTAAHELGHNLGLRHHDSHGNLTYTGSPSVISTGNEEDTHVMATGSTGLGESGRETARDFSINSLVKLAYAAGTLPINPVPITEIIDAGATIATATAVALEAIPVANRFGEVIIGTTGLNDVDVYKVSLAAGSVLTADVNIDYDDFTPFDNVNLFLEVLDSAGTVIASNDVGTYDSTQFGSGLGFGDGFDPVVYNVPIATAGDYYVRLSPEVFDFGDYQLLIHTDLLDNPVVPEPSSLALLTLGAVGFGVLRQRRRRNC